MPNANTSKALLSVFPPSPLTTVAGAATYSCTLSGTTPAARPGTWAFQQFDDPDVFAYEIKSQQTNGDTLRSFTLRVGKGGQLYSVQTDGIEVLPPQYRPARPEAHPSLAAIAPSSSAAWAPWVDDVQQAVVASGLMNTALPCPSETPDNTCASQGKVLHGVVGPWRVHDLDTEHGVPGDFTAPHQEADYKYFMHGAGCYLRDKDRQPLNTSGNAAPIYNPMLAAQGDPTTNSYASMHWMIQAHAPSIFPGHCVNYYRYRNIGGGIIEVNALIYNYRFPCDIFAQADPAAEHPNALDNFNFPHGGVRESNYGTTYLADGSGTLIQQGRQTINERPDGQPYDSSFGGWVCFANGTSANARAYAIIGGKGPQGGMAVMPEWMTGSLSWGSIDLIAPDPAAPTYQTYRSHPVGDPNGAARPPGILGGRNYQVASFIHKINLTPGRGVWARWYIGVGRRSNLQTIVAEKGLVGLTDLGITDFREVTAPLIAWYMNTAGGAPLTDDQPPGANPLFYTYAEPVNGTVPLFLVESQLGTFTVTNNPYVYSYGDVDPADRSAPIRERVLDGVSDPTEAFFRSHESVASGMNSNKGWTCLGFVPVSGAATDANVAGTALPYAALSTIGAGRFTTSQSTGFDLQVRTGFRIVCVAGGGWISAPPATAVSTVAAGSDTTSTRWRLVPVGPGPYASDAVALYFIENEATGTRLRVASTTTVDHAPATETGIDVQWRLNVTNSNTVRIASSAAPGNALADVAGSVALAPIVGATGSQQWTFSPIV